MQTLWLRHILQVDIVFDGVLVEFQQQADIVGHLQDAFLFRGENRALVRGGVVQGLNAKGVTREEELPFHTVPNGNAEHATQVPNHVGTPVMVAHDYGLPVTLGIEGIAEFGEFFAQLNVVVNLAIESHGVAIGLVRWSPSKRLVGML